MDTQDKTAVIASAASNENNDMLVNIDALIHGFAQIELPADQQVFSQGQACENYVVVTSGSVKVFARSSEGKEVVLYRIKAGEVCVLTTSCLLGNSRYPAEAITETPVSARIIPHKAFDALLAESQPMREFVFNSFGQRLNDLMVQIEQIALESVDQRLNRFLVKHADAQRMVTATHQEIAIEIGSAREVVSRNLKALEKQQAIKLHRGKLELINLGLLNHFPKQL